MGDILRIHHTGNAERSKRLRRSRVPRMIEGDVGMLPLPRRMRIRLGPLGVVDVEGLLPRLLSRVLPLLTTVEEGNADFSRRMSLAGAVDVEGLSLRLLQRVPPLPVLSTVEEGSAEVPRRKIRRLRKLNARAIADGLIL